MLLYECVCVFCVGVYSCARSCMCPHACIFRYKICTPAWVCLCVRVCTSICVVMFVCVFMCIFLHVRVPVCVLVLLHFIRSVVVVILMLTVVCLVWLIFFFWLLFVDNMVALSWVDSLGLV